MLNPLDGPNFVHICVSNNFTSVMVVLCPEDTGLPTPSPNSGFYILSNLSSMIFLKPWHRRKWHKCSVLSWLLCSHIFSTLWLNYVFCVNYHSWQNKIKIKINSPNWKQHQFLWIRANSALLGIFTTCQISKTTVVDCLPSRPMMPLNIAFDPGLE